MESGDRIMVTIGYRMLTDGIELVMSGSLLQSAHLKLTISPVLMCDGCAWTVVSSSSSRVCPSGGRYVTLNFCWWTLDSSVFSGVAHFNKGKVITPGNSQR